MNNRRLAKLIRDLRYRKKANSFFYFLSHNFIFRHFFYDDLPAEYLAKEGIGLTLTILSYLYRFTRKVIYFLFLYGFLAGETSDSFLMIFILLAIARELFTGIFLFNEEDYDMIILLKAEPRDYARYLMRHYLLEQGLLFALAAPVVSSLTGISYLRVLYWILMRLAISFIFEAVGLLISEKRAAYVQRRMLPRVIIAVICLIAVAVSVFADVSIPNRYMELAGILMIISAVGAWMYLYGFEKYDLLFKYNLLELSINGKNKSLVIDGIDYNSINKKIKVKDSEDNTRETGYRYIYRLFTSRYRRNIYGSFIVFVLLSLAVVAVLMFLPKTALFTDILEIDIDGDFIYSVLPNMFFIMYCFTSRSAKQFAQLCFFQLDRYLINYNFYRTKQAIMENLRLRLRTVLGMNLIIGLILALGLSGAMAVHSPLIEPGRIAVCFLLPLVLAVFFCFYNITSYYLLQPYSFDGTVVNKTYPIIDGVVYLISYLLMDFSIPISLPILAAVTFVLAVISAVMFVLVIRKAPKAFRVR